MEINSICRPHTKVKDGCVVINCYAFVIKNNILLILLIFIFHQWMGVMNFSLLLNTSPYIQIHFYAAIVAFLIGAFQLLTRKGTALHKVLGRLWVLTMSIICVSSFWIKELMPNGILFGYSPIHFLSVFVLIQISLGVYFARVGNILGHKKCMTYTYVGGLLVAGAFTFYPDRLLYKVFIEVAS
jgi:uncharacterized membrane protein